MPQLGWIPQQFIKLDQDQRADLSQYVICGVHLAPGSSEGRVRAWKVNADNTNGGEIAIPNQGGKDDTVTCQVLADGGVRFVVSEAVAPGASGSTAVPFAYVVPGVFAPAPPPASSGDAIGVVPPGGFIRVKAVDLDDAPFPDKTQEVIDLSLFGIPPTVRKLKIKVTATSDKAGARGRAGPDAGGSGANMITTICQAPGIRNNNESTRAPGVGGTLLLWADNGALREFYVDVMEWWY